MQNHVCFEKTQFSVAGGTYLNSLLYVVYVGANHELLCMGSNRQF